MQKPGLNVFETFNQVGVIVKRATRSSQQPWVSTSPIDGSFYFSGSSGNQVATADPETNILPSTSNMAAIAPSSARARSDFLLADSDTRRLTSNDLKGLSKDDLRIARNEIFARRGRYFSSPDLTSRFSKFSWYQPHTWDPQLNDIEKANVAFIESFEPVDRTQSDFIIPDSDKRFLLASDLRKLSKEELRIARNEIFARRGRYFEAPDLKARFERFSWYSPNTWNPKLNSIEEANVALLDKIDKR
jgi:hypothetical protein